MPMGLHIRYRIIVVKMTKKSKKEFSYIVKKLGPSKSKNIWNVHIATKFKS